MKTDTLVSSLTTAAEKAKLLVADKNEGRSPFAAPIRSNIDHAAALLADHEKWLAANPLPAEKPVAPAN